MALPAHIGHHGAVALAEGAAASTAGQATAAERHFAARAALCTAFLSVRGGGREFRCCSWLGRVALERPSRHPEH